jgi:hypothetical protein
MVRVVAAALLAVVLADAQALPRLRGDGRRLARPDGSTFVWRGVTAFRLIDQLADGNERQAIAYLDWARDTGFNLVRVLTVIAGWADLAPEDGARLLPRLLDLAAARGLYVEAVGIVESRNREYDWRLHARRVAEICHAASNCVFEFANEPGHGSQDPRLGDMTQVDSYAAAAVRDLPHLVWSAGSGGYDYDPTPAGRYLVRHLDRGGDPLVMVGRLRELFRLSEQTGRYVVSDEPIGADELDGSQTGKQRIDRPEIFYAMGILCRGFQIGCTFHLEAGVQTQDPGPVQRRAARDLVDASRLVPDNGQWRPLSPGESASPVASMRDLARGGRVVSADSFVAQDSGPSFVVLLHSSPTAPMDALVWSDGWEPREVIGSRRHVTVVRVARQKSLGGSSH